MNRFTWISVSLLLLLIFAACNDSSPKGEPDRNSTTPIVVTPSDGNGGAFSDQDKEAIISLAARFCSAYLDNDYDKIYTMFSPREQSEHTEEDVAQFFKNAKGDAAVSSCKVPSSEALTTQSASDSNAQMGANLTIQTKSDKGASKMSVDFEKVKGTWYVAGVTLL